MENKIAYLEARVSVLGFILLSDIQNLKNYINSMEKMKQTIEKEATPELKQLFETHFEQLPQSLAWC